MTDQTNADLIAEARRYVSDHDVYADNHLLRGLADALEAAEQERDEARKAAEDHVLDADAVHVRLSAELREVEQERDNWKLSAEEAERAEKRWKDCAVEADRQARAAEAEAEHLHMEDTREIVALTQERDQYAAVVEKVRVARGNHPACEEHPDGDVISCGWKSAVLDIDVALASAPADILRERDAEKWDEGDAARRMYVENRRAGRNVTMPRNPYRSGEQDSHNAPQRREEQA